MDFYKNQIELIKNKYNLDEFIFHLGKKLGDNIQEIKLNGQEDIYHSEEKQNESPEEKLHSLITGNGFIHFPNGTSFIIKNGLIIGFKIIKGSLGEISNLKQTDIEKLLGKPSKTEEEILTYVFDAINEGIIYYYKSPNISIQFDSETNFVKEVRIKKQHTTQG